MSENADSYLIRAILLVTNEMEDRGRLQSAAASYVAATLGAGVLVSDAKAVMAKARDGIETLPLVAIEELLTCATSFLETAVLIALHVPCLAQSNGLLNKSALMLAELTEILTIARNRKK